MEYLENKFFLLAFTFGVFFLSRVLQKKTGWVVLNPILLTIAVLILFLKFTGISYETYNEGGHLIEFWLKPAVVALGVPLYLQLEMIKKQLLPIVISQLAGCCVGQAVMWCKYTVGQKSRLWNWLINFRPNILFLLMVFGVMPICIL